MSPALTLARVGQMRSPFHDLYRPFGADISLVCMASVIYIMFAGRDLHDTSHAADVCRGDLQDTALAFKHHNGKYRI